MNKLKKIGLIILWVVGTAYLSFQYFRIADFPIGHDVINHIQRSLAMRDMSVSDIFKNTLYPIPALLFVWFYDLLHKTFGWDWPRVFLFIECSFLFLTALFSGILSWVIFKKWPIVIITSFLVASSRWLNGSLHTGLMGEAFGWSVFVVCLILLIQKKWFWFFFSFIFLFFSHPLPFGVMCIYLFVYIVFYAIWQKQYWFLFFGLLSILIIMLVGYFALPEKRELIISILQMKFSNEGEWRRTYIIASDFRRFNQYLFGLLGFCAVWLLKAKISQEKRRIVLIFAILSFFVTFKYLFGIHYLSFRYYTYFEIFNSVLAAFLVWFIADSLISKAKLQGVYRNATYFIILIFISFMLIYPNTNATFLFTKSDLAENTATTTPVPERTLITEATQKLNKGGAILGQRRWVWWFQSYGLAGIYDDNIFSTYEKTYENNPDDLLTILKGHNATYLYLSSVDGNYSFEKAEFLKIIYNKENIRIYEVE